jgi:transcriptional regulator with XRE-family HTH domain
MTFGERLAVKRREKGWSQRALARHAGVSHTIVADLEKGARRSISTDAAKKLARALGVSVDYLIGTFEDAPEDEDALSPMGVGEST